MPGPRCHCGTKITHVSGKVPRVYCSDRCRKAAKRLISRSVSTPSGAAGQDRPEATPDRRLGTTAKTTDMQVSGLHHSGADAGESERAQRLSDQEPARYSGADTGTDMAPDADTSARDGRFVLRDDLRPISLLERLIKCGVSVLAGGVVPVLRKGRAGFAGVVTCGSVHVCPCCSTSVRRVRQDELDQVGQFWECQSCGLVMMTLTMRHYERQLLAVLAEQQRTAWREGFGQNAGRDWRDAKKKFGVRGFVRAWEVTHGPNGWHCHYHVLLFLARPLNSLQVEELQHLAFTVWSAALEKAGAYLPVEKDEDGNPIGVRIDAPDRGESGTMARYLMKGQDGKTRWGIASELTRQDVKQGQGGHRTPFEIARAAVLANADPRDIALWREFEAVATGIRSLYWSNGLRKLLASMGFELDTRQDGQVAADEANEGERLALIPAATWYRHIVRHKGRSLALLKAAELGGTTAIRKLIESWGLVWGADVVEAEHLEPAGAMLTADEMMRRIERTAKAARAEAWRRGFDQAVLADRRKEHADTADAPQTRDRIRQAKQDRVLTESRAEKAGAERRANNDLPPQWWAQYEDPEVLAKAREIATEPTPNAAQAEFRRRRRIVAQARPEETAAALARVRAKG